MKKNLIIVITILICANAMAQNVNSNGPQVKTTDGVLEGIIETSGVHSFKGVPFAQPPVGDLRWKEPQSPKPWNSIRKADKFGPQAMQRGIYSDMMFRSDGKSEDCLYLNVWTPAKPGSGKLPVLVYFYGGGFSAGDGSELRYDGEALAKQGVITITVNYRLGIFGFMAHPELTKESLHHVSGNYGLMDQHAALVWVQKNIAAFGGDPKKVTIAGESAGSMSVSGQVASPLSKGLFISAIGESGALLGNLSPSTLSAAENNGLEFAKTVAGSPVMLNSQTLSTAGSSKQTDTKLPDPSKAISIADLRKIPAEKLLELSAKAHFSCTVDGYFLPEAPQVIFATGKQMQVNLLAGWNSAEGSYPAVLGKDSATIDNFKGKVMAMYGLNGPAILKVYAPASDAEVKQIATELASDRFIAFSTWKFIDMHSKTSSKPVYRYYFTRPRPNFADGKPNHPAGAVHSAEIEYALGNLPTNKVYAWQPDDYKVSETMQAYFLNFIKTGNPNGNGLTQWDALKPGLPNVMVIDVNCRQKQSTTEDRYILLDGLMK